MITVIKNDTIKDYCITNLITNIEANNAVIEMTNTFLPYNTIIITCKNIILIHFHRTTEDESPYFCDIFFERISGEKFMKLLIELQYPFLNVPDGLPFSGKQLSKLNVFVPNGEFSHIHFDGCVYGDIICQDILEYDNQNEIQNGNIYSNE
ncbi:MAG: hypothetical protein LBP87_01760 [Planctomycetaceae bacterium]|jgi:hypothetical protein|nr:hypothetical protein [Planctomycetaceae bacterium]